MAWENAGVEANVLTYRNEGADPAEQVKVVIDTMEPVEGAMPGQVNGYRLRPVPVYHFTLYRYGGVGVVGRKSWTPSRRLNPQAPSPRTIAKIANEIAGKR